MYSIKENTIYTYEIKKSKFITLLYKINDQEEVNNFLKEVKKEYKDATHYCYGYKVNSFKKCSDDGEPSGTAGLPILEILDKKNLDNILCIVVRYFGGIKLGAGGLIRAYATSVKEAIDNTEIIKLKDGYQVKIEADYEDKKEIEYVFKDNIIETKYEEKIIYILEIDNLEKIKNYNYEILKEIKIEAK